MALTTAQLTTIKAHILASPDMSVQPMSSDGAFEIARLFNLQASPAFTVWRSNVSANEIGNAWVGTDIDGMSSLNMQRLQLLLASSPQGVFDMSRADRRAGFENPFGTNVNNASRVAMRAIWKRLVSRAEKLFATGTGSDADPAVAGWEGSISYQDVQQARDL